MNRFPSLSDENLKIKHSLRDFFSVYFLKLVHENYLILEKV